MLDIGWSELLVIAMVAVVVVGPKDLPRMLRGFGNFMGRMKRMSRDFQRQFNDALKEAELDDVKKSVEQIGKIDPLADIKKELAPAKKMGDDIRRELGVPVPAAAAAPAATPGVNLAVPLNGSETKPAGDKAAPDKAAPDKAAAEKAATETPAGDAATVAAATAMAAPAPGLNGSGHPAPVATPAAAAEAKP